MAELSTIARPYAEALFSAARGNGTLDAWLVATQELAQIVAHPQVAAVVADPKVESARVLELLPALMKAPLPADGRNFIATLIDNGRLATLPEVARQFRQLKNEADGVADCTIESAFPIGDGELAELLAALTRRFGLTLKPSVQVNPALIGGVRVTVGDHVLDTSVASRLQQMHAALTAA